LEVVADGGVRRMSGMAFDFLPAHPGRSLAKPRASGLTMTIDAGIPIGRAADMLELAGPYVDIAKIKTGSARLYEADYLKRKIALYREHGMDVFPGGQFLEYVVYREGEEAVAPYLDEAASLGFTALEVSDNVVPLTDNERGHLIGRAVSAGLKVFGEVGSKESATDATTLVRQAQLCFDAGASLVLVEAAEFFEAGRFNAELLLGITGSLDMARVLIELPGTWISDISHHMIDDMAKLLVREVGPDVNLGNVAFDSLLDLEATRMGLGVAGPPGAGKMTMKA